MIETPKWGFTLQRQLLVIFYRRFCQSPNFQGWYNQRKLEINSKLQELHMQALCNTSWTEWVVGRQEVEIVDLIIRMKEKLVSCCSYPLHHHRVSQACYVLANDCKYDSANKWDSLCLKVHSLEVSTN